jgi:muramoyltetrapeptide carboxypeptidase LdcA involved in peptidoglycan recycling
MKYAGWFDYTKAVIVGRVLFESSETGMSYEDAVKVALPDIPVLYQADVGHTIPSMTMINGALLDLSFEGKKAELNYSLK